VHTGRQDIVEDEAIEEGADGGLADESDERVEEDNAGQRECYRELLSDTSNLSAPICSVSLCLAGAMSCNLELTILPRHAGFGANAD
jgi:hypothetical protein